LSVVGGLHLRRGYVAAVLVEAAMVEPVPGHRQCLVSRGTATVSG
jgi:hypothetical protein